MDYKKLEETAMCYKCDHKAICKIVYQANDCGIQLTKWNCSHYTEERSRGVWVSKEEILKIVCDTCPVYNCVSGCNTYRCIEKMSSKEGGAENE